MNIHFVIAAPPAGHNRRAVLRVRMRTSLLHRFSARQSVNATPGGQDGHVPDGAFSERGSRSPSK